MKKWLILLLVIGLLVPEFAIRAQDEPRNLAPWPVIERCVGPATAPPESWTYPGVIMFTGYAGLHGVSQAWATPRVLSFDFKTGYGSSLSPDGRWYAVPQIRWVRHDNSYSVYVDEIRVYSTASAADNITLPWGLLTCDYFWHVGDDLTLRWVDAEHFVYPGTNPVQRDHLGWNLLVNPVSGKIANWTGAGEISSHPYHFFPSPDWSRAVVDSRADGQWALIDPMTGAQIKDLPDLALFSRAAWSPDATAFAASKHTPLSDGENEIVQLLLFDAVGTLRATIFEDTVPLPTQLTRLAWSNPGQIVSFIIQQDPYNYPPHLYLADVANERVFDTCLELTPGAWSPDGLQFAVMPPDDRDHPIYVFDLEQWALYTVAYHSGTIIGWR